MSAAFSCYPCKTKLFNEVIAVKKLALCFAVLIAGSLLCSACGLKNDLYLPEDAQAAVQIADFDLDSDLV